MSMITRCPACLTMFRVVPDQLRLSEGWVRCGQCEEVFDALAHFQPPSVADQTQMPESQRPEASQPAPIPAAPVVLPTEAEELAEVAPQPEPAEPAQPLLSAHASDVRIDPELITPRPSLASSQETSASFLRRAATTDPESRSSVRYVLWGSLCVLVLSLLLQVLRHERDRLVAAQPALRPVMERLCEIMGCRVEALRRIESVVIDSSSFNKLRADLYRLNLVLKNQAPFDLAMPALELTLTDDQDHVVSRRVIAPGELAQATNVLAAHDEATISMNLALNSAGPNDRVAGYRVLAFYP